jgi:DNA polymerase
VADLYLDLETYSTVPLQHGTHRYAEPSEVLLVAYAWDNDPVTCDDVSDCWEDYAPLLQKIIDDADRVVIHNSHFDRTVLYHNGVYLQPRKIVDTMVMAMQHSLPGGLDYLCRILGVPHDQAKDAMGKKLIQLFCKPQPPHFKLRRATRETHPLEWEAFKVYAGLDVEAMRAVRPRIPKWNWTASERALWLLDQETNDKGVQVDLELARAALTAFERSKVSHAERSHVLTKGRVPSTTQRDKLFDYLRYGEELDFANLTKSTIEALLEDADLTDETRELLKIRLQAAAASPAKYRAFLRSSSTRDARVRGTLQFCGAGRTGRDAGRLVQLQNLPLPTMTPVQVEFGVNAIKRGTVHEQYENVSEVCVNAVRGCLIAAPGKKLVVADLSNIEGRVAAWLAGERWKLDAFKSYDAGIGDDLYVLSYARSFNTPVDEVLHNKAHGDGSMRQIGKVQELALQFQGSVGAYVSMGANYGVDPYELATITRDIASEEEWAAAYDSFRKRWAVGLDRETWTGVKVVVNAWRGGHLHIQSMWYEIEDAVRAAIREPTETFEVRGLEFDMVSDYLRIRLPSGRYLSYKQPSVGNPCDACEGVGELPDPEADDPETAPIVVCPDCDGAGRIRDKICYWGVGQKTRRWEKISAYGGKFFENIVQATARDVFMGGYRRAMREGYPVVLRVHDELVTEVPDEPDWNHGALAAIMTAGESWTLGLPLAAAGHDLYRYAKEG